MDSNHVTNKERKRKKGLNCNCFSVLVCACVLPSLHRVGKEGGFLFPIILLKETMPSIQMHERMVHGK